LTLSLDTSVLVDLVNDRHLVRRNFAASVDTLVTSSLAAHELLFGAMISRRVDFQLDNARDLLAQLRVAEFDQDDARTAAQVRATLRAKGQTIGSLDSLIAGQALARGWTIVTANTHEFARIDGLNVIDWTAPAD
jgi:tRNA(fMet)-specific endonuclease VapC